MRGVIPFPIDHTKRADEIQGICIGCDQSFTRRSAPNPIWCYGRWFNEGRLGMT